MMWDRLQSRVLLQYLKLFPVVALVGPRQVGKSTLVLSKDIGYERKYYTLDDFNTLDVVKKEPKTIIEQHEFITLDEVQKYPDILVEIKKDVDKKRIPGKYLLTGSAELSFAANIANILAGRVGIIEMYPISWWEVERKKGIPWLIQCLNKKKLDLPAFGKKKLRYSLDEMIIKGGYPLALLSKTIPDAKIWFEGYKQSYLEREIKQFTDILHLSEFAKLLSLCSSRTGQLLNQADLSRNSGLTPMTLSRYLNLLEATFQIQRIQPYFTNISKRQAKSSKIYWRDTGMASHLLALNSIKEMKEKNLWGQIFETFVMMQVETYLQAFKPSCRLYFWRTHSGLEIDGLIIDGLNKLPFEIKASTNLDYKDAKGLREFISLNENCKYGFVFYLGETVTELGKNIWGLPIYSLIC